MFAMFEIFNKGRHYR